MTSSLNFATKFDKMIQVSYLVALQHFELFTDLWPQALQRRKLHH